MSTLYVRTPTGEIRQHDDALAALCPVGPCTLEDRRVCDHGYRLDLREIRMNGDGCPVVAVDRDQRNRRVAWVFGVNNMLQARLVTLAAGSAVEVLLDDGRVVLTKTRSAPWNIDKRTDDGLVLLEGFSGGYSITRMRLPHWKWAWTHRLAPEPGAAPIFEVARPDDLGANR